jgi:hypothetical protein
METFVEHDFSSHFNIILALLPSAAGYMVRNLYIVSPQAAPSVRFKKSDLCESLYQMQC